MLGSNSNGGGGGGSDASVFFPGLWTIYASREKAALGWRARSHIGQVRQVGRAIGRADRLGNEFGLA